MSRIGKKPILVPKSVSATLKDNTIKFTGEYGSLKKEIPKNININIINDSIILVPNAWNKTTKQYLGLTRTLLQNMLLGVSQKFIKTLIAEGIGYKFQVLEKNLLIYVGFVHPVNIQIPGSLEIKQISNSKISISGIEKEKVGLLAAKIKSIKPPEPYKGKGIFYEGETIQRKIGKKTK